MKKILLIEDNLAIRENTTELLEISGYEVIPAVDGRQGLELMRSTMPDLVLCDIMMPELDGYQVIQEMRQDPGTKHIPFVFATASAEKSEMRRGLEMGADGYLRKPFDEVELLSTIKECLLIQRS